GQLACAEDATAMCLNNGRFRVTAAWRSAQGSGQGQAVRLTGDSGYFWFFSASNAELIVKALNACSFNHRYWVFSGGLTNVGHADGHGHRNGRRQGVREPAEHGLPADPGHVRVRDVPLGRRAQNPAEGDSRKKSRTAAMTASVSASESAGNIGSETVVAASASASGRIGGWPRSAIAGWRWLAIG